MSCFRLMVLSFGIACGINQLPAQETLVVDFAEDVQPLFRAHCTSYHGPKIQKNGFRLDRRRDALKGGTANQIGPGNSEASRLYLRLVGDQAGLRMPPDGPSNNEQIKIIKCCIDQGAILPSEMKVLLNKVIESRKASSPAVAYRLPSRLCHRQSGET